MNCNELKKSNFQQFISSSLVLHKNEKKKKKELMRKAKMKFEKNVFWNLLLV